MMDSGQLFSNRMFNKFYQLFFISITAVAKFLNRTDCRNVFGKEEMALEMVSLVSLSLCFTFESREFTVLDLMIDKIVDYGKIVKFLIDSI